MEQKLESAFTPVSVEKEKDVTIEFCYKNMDGSISVRYRRIKGTPACDGMMEEIKELQTRQGDRCCYFTREV